jgi:hypothetical protein
VISLGTAVGLFAIGRAQGFASILAATALFAVFARAVIPMLLSVPVRVEDHPHAFGWVRAFGTVGFAASMFAFPAALDAYQASHGLAATPAADRTRARLAVSDGGALGDRRRGGPRDSEPRRSRAARGTRRMEGAAAQPALHATPHRLHARVPVRQRPDGTLRSWCASAAAISRACATCGSSCWSRRRC